MSGAPNRFADWLSLAVAERPLTRLSELTENAVLQPLAYVMLESAVSHR